MRIQFACLLLVLLSATELSEAALSFREKHIAPDIDQSNYHGKMDVINRECKPNHTFIKAPEDEVNKVCDQRESNDYLAKSKQRFRIIFCKIQKDDPSFSCTAHYYDKKFIHIRCNGNMPYHFV